MIKVTNEEFLPSEGKSVVFFSAPWCVPCKGMLPVVATLEAELEDVTFYSVCIDELPALSELYRIRTIPTLILFKGNEVVSTLTGTKTKEALQAEINKGFEA